MGQTFQQEYWSVTTFNGKHTLFKPPIGVQWCGVYAVWVWKQAGIDMEWELNTPSGNNNGPYRPGSTTRILWSNDLTHLAPGDIIVKEKPFQHHMIVISTSLEDAPLKLGVLQGNSGSGNRTQTTVSRTVVDRAGSGYLFYSIDRSSRAGSVTAERAEPELFRNIRCLHS